MLQATTFRRDKNVLGTVHSRFGDSYQLRSAADKECAESQTPFLFWLRAYLLIDACVPVVLLCCSTQDYSLQVRYDVELAIVVVVVLDPGRLHSEHLAPAHTLHSAATSPAVSSTACHGLFNLCKMSEKPSCD